MNDTERTRSHKPYDIHERLLAFACDVVRAAQFRFRLRVCRHSDLLDARFDALIAEAEELVRILGKIVHNACRNRDLQRAMRSRGGR